MAAILSWPQCVKMVAIVPILYLPCKSISAYIPSGLLPSNCWHALCWYQDIHRQPSCVRHPWVVWYEWQCGKGMSGEPSQWTHWNHTRGTTENSEESHWVGYSNISVWCKGVTSPAVEMIQSCTKPLLFDEWMNEYFVSIFTSWKSLHIQSKHTDLP